MEYQELLDILKMYMTEDNLKEIDKYYQVALKIYDGMTRITGEPYINHSIRVAKILAELKMNTITIGCALIHEGITLDKLTYDEVSEMFDENVAKILNSISKLSHLKRTFHFKNDADKYRRIVVGLSENPITLFIKLADRLDNLRTIQVHDKEHIKEVCNETEMIFIPIAHRLGIKSMKSELEDLCLRNMDPVGYNEVLEKINKDRSDLEASLYKMRDELILLLKEHNIKFDITYRVKSVRGIYNKLKLGKKWNDIYDLLGLRILLNTPEECYLVVGIIHSKYRPIPKRFKDFIANPKNNMYQSLHTTVFGVDGNKFEIQLRTHEMDEIAEHGVASHWSYKEKTDGSKQSALEARLQEFRTLIEINDIEGNNDFFKNFNNNLVKEEIYIFTPKGDIIELPMGSTPIDFAYKIHSEVGNTTIGALVNGKIVSLDYKLSDGDIVDLKTQKGKTPSKSWLKFVRTANAKSRIKSYFYKKEKDKAIETGKELILEELKRRNIKDSEILVPEIYNKVLEDLKENTIEDIYVGVGTLKYSQNLIVNKLEDIYRPKKDDTIEKLLNNNELVKHTDKGKIIIAGYGDILTRLANCCNPVLGDDIVGYITKGSGVLIHRRDCKNINLNDERIIDALWNDKVMDKYISHVTVYLNSSNENLANILTLATKYDVNITSINNKGKQGYDEAYDLSIKVKNKETLYRFMIELNSMEFVSKVER